MSKWEQHGTIEAAYSDSTGELMLSASDVVAFMRSHAGTMSPRIVGVGVNMLADHLAGLCIEATRNLLDDGSGS